MIIDRSRRADEQIRWYLDGRLFFSVSEHRVGRWTWERAVDHGFSIIFDLAIGGSYPHGACGSYPHGACGCYPHGACGCAAPNARTSSRGTMSIRYVAVYERPAERG